MGVCQSQEEKDMINKTREIDRDLLQNHLMNQKVVKLLLLGAGECGKSTILKQMKILHDHGFSDEEKLRQRFAVYNNTVTGMATILRGMNQLNLHFSNPKLENEAHVILEVVKKGEESEAITEEVGRAVKLLWADRYVKEAAIIGEKFQLPETSTYFFENIDRITAPNYLPTERDILLTRIKTTGIIEVRFTMKAVDFRVFDVGGQRSERKKWIHCFEGVHAIIFITAISEFDQVLFEDEKTNRLIESMRLFESICNSRWFISTSMILFMNKTDLFIEKIKRISIRVTFLDYKGSNSYDDQVKYLETKFEALNANLEKNLYIHQTCATDTNQVQLILENVIDLVIQKNLEGCGLY